MIATIDGTEPIQSPHPATLWAGFIKDHSITGDELVAIENLLRDENDPLWFHRITNLIPADIRLFYRWRARWALIRSELQKLDQGKKKQATPKEQPKLL